MPNAYARFLLAQLHVNSLASAAGLSIRHVRNRLNTLPTTLMTTYDEAMIRITSQDDDCKAVALKTLAWVNYAFRSLSLKELQHALAIEPGSCELDDELIMDAQSITALCAGLITVEPGTDMVNFVHYTACDYFEDKRQIHFPNFHGNITMSCATYLTMPALHNTTIGTIVKRFPLACYAAQFMGDHARQHPEETLEQSILETIYQLLSHSKKRQPLLSLLDGLDLIRSGFYSAMQDAESEDGSPSEVDALQVETADPGTLKRQESKLVEVTALHLAASMGLAKVASMLIKEHPDIDAVDETGKTALAVAIERGFEKAVEFLVNSGARIDLEETHGQQAFLLLIEKRWHTVANVVAERAKVKAAADSVPVHLLINAFLGNVEKVSSLLAQSAPDTDPHHARALALFIAVERANPDMLQTILASNVEVDSRDNTGQTSLHRATRAQNKVIIKILLNHGAKIDLMNDEWRTPWSANVSLMNEQISQTLIKAGANPNTRDHDGATVLYFAAAGGHTDIVRFVLKAGTDPSIRTNFDWAPLHWAAYHEHSECVKLLVDAGADLSPTSDQGTTPLDLAFKNHKDAMADFLINAGAKEAKEVREQQFEFSNVYRYKTAEIEETDSIIMTTEALTIIEPDEPALERKMTLTFDRPLQQSLEIGQFIYPDIRRSTSADAHSYADEETQAYQISHMLDSFAPTISVKRSASRPTMDKYPLAPGMFVYNDVLYNIFRVSSDYQELEMSGSSLASLPGIIKLRRAWSGTWKAHHDHQRSRVLLFRTTPEWSTSTGQVSRWTAEDGTLLARTGGEREFQMRFEQTMKAEMMDVLVTCWIAKQWSDIMRNYKG